MSGPDAATQQQLQTIARGGALNLVGAIVAATATFLLVVVVARTVEQEAAGALFAATSVMMILIGLAALGTDTGLARFLLRFEATGRRQEIDAVIRVAATPVAAATMVLSVAVLVGAGPLADIIGLDIEGGSTMLRILAGTLPFAVANDFALAGTRAFGRMRPTVTIDRIGRSVVQIAALLAVGLGGGGAIALMIAWSLPYVVFAGLSVLTFDRMLRRRRQGRPEPTPVVNPGLHREFWHFTWPRSVARVCQVVIQRADIVIIASLLGTADAAVYTAATRFVVLGQFAMTAIVQVLQPRFTELLARGEVSTVRDIFKVSTAWSMAMAWPLYLVVAGAAPLYLDLFGELAGDDGVVTVVVMAVAMMFASAAGPLDTLLLMAGGSTASLLNAGVATIVDLAGCFILVPTIGIDGAAIAWGAAVVVRNALTWVQVRRLLDVSPLSRAGGVVAAASVVCVGGPVLLATSTAGADVVPVAIAGLVGLGAYAGALWSQRQALALGSLRALVVRRRPGPIATG